MFASIESVGVISIVNSFSPSNAKFPEELPSTETDHPDGVPLNPTLIDHAVFPSFSNVAVKLPVSSGLILILVLDKSAMHFFNSGMFKLMSSVSSALPLGFWSPVTTPFTSQQYFLASLPSGTSNVTVTHSDEPLSIVTCEGSTSIEKLPSWKQPEPDLVSTVRSTVS